MTELTRSIRSGETLKESDQLVIRLKEGDDQAFVEAYHLYKDFVYTLAFKLLNDKGEAMDVTQEVFLTLFRKVGGFRGDSSLKTWLYRVAKVFPQSIVPRIMPRKTSESFLVDRMNLLRISGTLSRKSFTSFERRKCMMDSVICWRVSR